MTDKTAVNLTLHFTVHTNEPVDIPLIALALMQGAVESSGRQVTGTGYDYEYSKKKSRRGMSVTNPKGRVGT